MMRVEIHNPRRILAVALAESQDHLTRVVGDLTGTYPKGSGSGNYEGGARSTLAGTTHELPLTTAYYRALVPVWLDLVGAGAENEKRGGKEDNESNDRNEHNSDKDDDSRRSEAVDSAAIVTPQRWADAFLSDEAREVREALGGVVAVVAVDSDGGIVGRSDGDGRSKDNITGRRQQRDLVEHVGRLVRGLGASSLAGLGDDAEGDDDNSLADLMALGTSWDGIGIVVGVSETLLDEDAMLAWDDHCTAAGLEFVLVAPGQADKNAWGEKTGISRVREALEANDWTATAAITSDRGDVTDNNAVAGDDDDDEAFGEFQDVLGSDLGRLDDFADIADLNVGLDRSDFEGLRQTIWQQQTRETADTEAEDDANDGDDRDAGDYTASMERLMGKLQAARLQAELLSPTQRRAMVARVVGEVMEEI